MCVHGSSRSYEFAAHMLAKRKRTTAKPWIGNLFEDVSSRMAVKKVIPARNGMFLQICLMNVTEEEFEKNIRPTLERIGVVELLARENVDEQERKDTQRHQEQESIRIQVSQVNPLIVFPKRRWIFHVVL